MNLALAGRWGRQKVHAEATEKTRAHGGRGFMTQGTQKESIERTVGRGIGPVERPAKGLKKKMLKMKVALDE